MPNFNFTKYLHPYYVGWQIMPLKKVISKITYRKHVLNNTYQHTNENHTFAYDAICLNLEMKRYVNIRLWDVINE